MTIAVFKLETDYPSENYPLDYPSRCENETINVFTLETDYPLNNSRQTNTGAGGKGIQIIRLNLKMERF